MVLLDFIVIEWILLPLGNKYKSLFSFIKVKLKYLITNWKLIDPNKRMNTLYVIFLNKRLEDLKWLVKNKNKFPHLEGEKLYKLLRLRDMLDKV